MTAGKSLVFTVLSEKKENAAEVVSRGLKKRFPKSFMGSAKGYQVHYPNRVYWGN